ncbi:amyloid fiber anchoring/assembly protein TapA [Sutcliffiella cohnii]
MKHTYSNFVLKIKQKISSFKRTDEGGSPIRYLRVNKFRKKGKKLLILAQILAIWYMSVLTASYLTSNTGAYFNDVEVIKGYISAGVWEEDPPEDNDEWDKSSLDFDGSKAWVEGCTVYTTISNTGDKANIESTWRFYLNKVDNGGNIIGDPVATGVVPVIESKGEGELTAQVREDGNYRFIVRRPLGHPAGNNPDEKDYTYINSDEIIEVESCSPGEDEETEPPSEEDKTPIGDVTNLEGIATHNSVTLSWIVPTGEEFNHVNIYRNGTQIAENIQGPQFIDVDLIENTEYVYKITTVDTNQNESVGVTKTITTSSESIDPIGEVDNFTVSRRGQSHNIHISWKNPVNERFSHIILYKNDIEISEGQVHQYDDKVTENGEYVYRIVTVDVDGNKSDGITKSITIN